LNQHLFKVTSDDFPKWFYYLWSKHHLAEFVSISSSHATTMGHIKRGDLDDAMVLVPSPEETKELSEIFTPLMDKIISNNKRLKNLASLQDTLLPKLMSGEVRIASKDPQATSLPFKNVTKAVFPFSKQGVILARSVSSLMNFVPGRQRIDLEHLKNFYISIPPKDVVDSFNETLKGIVPKLISNSKQIRTLESLRDTLLPKLAN
jgi:restriction endonuclease S subunit